MERVTLLWTRPDGQEAVEVVFTYETPELASEAAVRALEELGKPVHGGMAEWRPK